MAVTTAKNMGEEQMSNCYHSDGVEPTSKAPAIDLIISETAGSSREIQIASQKCVWCNGDAIDFKDYLSVKEYSISGMCQVCQDKTFGV